MYIVPKEYISAGVPNIVKEEMKLQKYRVLNNIRVEMSEIHRD